MNVLRDIKKGRIDLTDYLIHFTRKNEKGMSAFNVLKKIISDGYLKRDWSYRGKTNRRTVFGKTPAVCFTETPLYGFVDYVKKRNYIYAIDSYGISFSRKDLFRHGARNVFYGTTNDPNLVEEKDSEGNYLLKGFPLNEQYRYVLTTSVDFTNDWMHEREWRWSGYSFFKKEFKELAIWCQTEENYQFETIVIIVKNNAEREQITQLFKEIIIEIYKSAHPEKLNVFQLHARANIRATGIIVLNSIDFTKYPHYTIEFAIENNEVFWLEENVEEIKEGFKYKPS